MCRRSCVMLERSPDKTLRWIAAPISMDQTAPFYAAVYVSGSALTFLAYLCGCYGPQDCAE